MHIAFLGGAFPASLRTADTSRSKGFFDTGGGFERLRGGDELYARQFGRSFARNIKPGRMLANFGGAAANLPRAFGRSDTVLDVTGWAKMGEKVGGWGRVFDAPVL